MDKLKKGLVGSILISVILAVTLTYVWATTPTTTFYISTGVYPGAPTYTIWTEGSGATQAYYAKRYDGYIPTWSGSTNASYVINSATASLTNGGKIYFVSGTYTLTKPIIITHGYTFMEADSFGTTLKLGSNVNDDLIQIIYGIGDIAIRNFILDGNKANNTAGNCIYANSTGLILEDNMIKNAAENDIYLRNPSVYAGLHWIVGNHIIWAKQSGIVLYGVFDVFVGQNDIGQNDQNGIYGVSLCSSEIFDNQIWGSKYGSGINLTGCIGNSITNNRIDYNKRWGISVRYTNDTIITGNKIYLNSAEAVDTYPGVYVSGGSSWAVFSLDISHNNFHMSGNNQSRAVEVWLFSGKAQWHSIIGNNVIGNLSSPAMLLTNLTLSVVANNVGYP